MNKNKLIYEAPEAQTFVIRFEGNIMSPNYGSKGAAGGNDTYAPGDEEDLV